MSTPFHGGALALLAPLLGVALNEAIGAYLQAAMAGTILAAATEGTAVWWIVMAAWTRGPGHWFWRPFGWSAGLTLSSVTALVANVALLLYAMDSGGESSWFSIVAIWIPVVIAVPFSIVVVVLALIWLVRRARNAKGPVLAALRDAKVAGVRRLRSLPWETWLVAAGMWAVARAVILFAQALIGSGIVLAILPVLHVVAPAEPEVPLKPSVVIIVVVAGVAVAACSVPLLRLARPGGPLRPNADEASSP